MCPPEDDFRDDETDIENEDSMALDSKEIEELERLLYGCRMVEFKKEKVYVDVRATTGFIVFRGTNSSSAVSISFDFDRVTRQISNLNGVNMEWVKTFLYKYRIIED